MRRLDNIDLRLLRVFLTLVDAGGFPEAQIVLNLSPSTLSTHLGTLERKLGGRLCERGRGGFRLTQFGEATYAATRQLFDDIDSFHTRLGRDQGQLVGRLRIGIVDGVVTSPELGLQKALARFGEEADSVYIDLHLGTPQELEQSLSDGRRDLVIGPLSQKVPGVSYVPLKSEAHSLYCGRGHPLFSTPRSQLTREAINQSAFSVRGYRHLEDLYRVDHPKASASVIHMEAQVMLLLSGRYIGFLPRHIGDHWAERGEMRRLELSAFDFVSQHFVAVRRAEADEPIRRRFLEILKETAAREAGRGRSGTEAEAAE